MKYIDLFSGAGGLSLGFKNAGFQLAFSNEIDNHSVSSQKKNLERIGEDPKKVISCSIEELHSQIIGRVVDFEYQGNKVQETKASKITYSKAVPIDSESLGVVKKIKKKDVDLIIGGPPCQGFSAASKGKRSFLSKEYRNYVDDPRNQLFKYFLDFVDFYSPKIVLIENVKGLASSSNYKRLIETLKNTGKGYYTFSQILNSSRFGVPQIRERLFFVGVRKDIKDSEGLIFYLDSLLMGQSHKKVSLFEAISDLPQIKSNPKKQNTKEKDEIPIGSEGSFGENTSSMKYKKLIKNPLPYVKGINTFKKELIEPKHLYNHKCRYNNEDDLLIYSKMRAGKTLTNKENAEALKLVKYSTKNFADKYYKLDPDKPSRTIVAHLKNDNNGFIHYGKVPRGISVREAARIQSFPDWYKFEGPLTQQFKQIGNAVPPKLAFVFAKIFYSFLSGGLDAVFNESE